LATINAELETPDQAISGKFLVSGWAYATTGMPVTIILRVNGGDTGITISCCSSRQDVKNVHSDAPLNTGFGLLQNGGIFDADKLESIGVKITAQGESDKIIDHEVRLTKPGNAEFLNSFALGAGANAAVDGDEIVVGGAQVTFSGGSAKTNLRLKYEINLQSPTIIEAFDGTNAALFDPVQIIFNNHCIVCHSGPLPPQGLDLSAGNAWRNIVARSSVEDPSRPRVNPGDDERSYLYQKVIPGGTILGVRMPFGCSGNNCLSQSDIDTIEEWINDGARPPDGSSMGGDYGGGGGGGY
jgi:hypothetical protein